MKEAHHFYPLLFYFRFDEPMYAVSRFSFVLLDLTTLIDTALNKERYGTLQRSAAVTAVRECALLLLETLDRHFPTVKGTGGGDAAAAQQSYALAAARLQRENIELQHDADGYAEQRRRWEPLVRRVAPSLGYRMDEIDRRSPPSEDGA